MIKNIFTFLVLPAFCSLLFAPCSSLYAQTDEQFKAQHPGIHKVTVRAVLQTPNYTYLGARENLDTLWLAVPRMEAAPGEVYYYQGGNEMKDFKSTTLGRTFPSVWFLAGVVREDEFMNTEASTTPKTTPAVAKAGSGKSDEKIEPVAGGVSISELFAHREKYAGQMVKVKGKVTKFSTSIMGKNWIHLQDGTEFDGQFDFVATTDETVEQDRIIVVEGTIAVNKDFGYGYFYKVIMENTRVLP